MLLGGHDHWKVMEPDFLGKIFASPVVRDQDQFNDFIRIFFFQSTKMKNCMLIYYKNPVSGKILSLVL